MGRKEKQFTLRMEKGIVLLTLTILSLGMLSIGLTITLLGWPKFDSLTSSPKNSLEKIAQSILTKCAGNSYKPGCYDKEIPLTMTNLSMEQAFEVTKIIQREDSGYAYCHVLGHELSAREVKKDPAKWKDVIPRCPSGVCSNGCIHGAMQERFRSESLTDSQIENIKQDLATICEEKPNWNPTGLEQASCYHALGHLMMYITNADIKKSITLCDELAIKEDGRDLSRLCYDGSFMQIYQPLEPEDFALIKGKEVSKEKVQTFCSSFSPLPKSSCLSESWPLYSQEIKQPEGLIAFCDMEEPTERDRCLSSMFYVLTASFNFDTQKIASFCQQLPSGINEKCFSSSATRFIETDYQFSDKAIHMCSEAEKLNIGDRCFEDLIQYSTYTFHPGSANALKLCSLLPDPWNERCRSSNT